MDELCNLCQDSLDEGDDEKSTLPQTSVPADQQETQVQLNSCLIRNLLHVSMCLPWFDFALPRLL